MRRALLALLVLRARQGEHADRGLAGAHRGDHLLRPGQANA